MTWLRLHLLLITFVVLVHIFVIASLNEKINDLNAIAAIHQQSLELITDIIQRKELPHENVPSIVGPLCAHGVCTFIQ